MEDEDVMLNNKEIEIIEGEKIYNIDIKIGLRKLQAYLDLINNGVSYEEAFYSLINQDIREMSIANKIKIIDYIIDESGMTEYKEKFVSDDIFERLYKVIILYTENQMKLFIEAIKPFQDALKNINENIAKANIFPKLGTALEYIGEYARKTFEKITTMTQNLRDKLENSRKWAQYGWTSIPFQENYILTISPATQEDADKICLKIMTEENIKHIQQYLLDKINKRDNIEEAIKCYNNECYVACAMLLVSLIERNITELPLIDANAKKPRGKNIIKVYKDSLDEDETSLNDWLYLDNLFKYIDELFEDGKDFVEQKYNMNRNFLMHGWRDVRTTKVDCIKLLLALYNIIYSWNNKIIRYIINNINK